MCKTKKSVALAVGVGVLSGCGGAFPKDEAHEKVARANVQERIAFDLECDQPKVSRIGDVTRLGGQMTRMTFGVRCGDAKATYVVTCVSNWGDITCSPEMNTASAE